MAVRATTIPFSGGQDSTIDRRLAGLGKLRTAINARLDADGRVIARAGYTALGVTSYGTGNHVAYDLFDLDGRLCSLGDRRGLGHPSDVFEYVEGAAAVWKPTVVAATTDVPRLPRGTRLREIARPPDQRGGASAFDVSAVAGFVMLVYNDTGTPPLGAAMLLRAGSGQILLFQEFDGSVGPQGQLKAVGLTTRFWVLGFSPNTQTILGRRIDPITQEAFQGGSTTLLTDAGGFSAFAAEKVAGADQIVLATVSAAGDLVVRRYDDAGTLLVPSGGQYATFSGIGNAFVAVEADSAANQITAVVSDDGTLKLFSWNLSTGATLAAPPFTPTEVATETVTNVALVRQSSTLLQVLATCTSFGTPDVPRVFRWTYTVSTGTISSTKFTVGTRLTSGAVFMAGSSTVVFGAVTDNDATTPNMLLEQGSSGGDVLGIVAAKDLGFAMPPVEGLPRIAIDTSRTPDRYYWVHGVQSADGSSIPVVSEICLDDTGRRQIAKVGRGVVVSGACPCWYDGAQLVDLGFVERPVIVSLASSPSTGELQSGAVYSYIAVHSWFDSFGRLHRSPISLPVDITTGAADDTVVAVVSGAHTARANRGSAPLGSVVRAELYRTRAIVAKTKAALTAPNGLNPPSSSLTGLGMGISITDSTGTTVFDFLFTAGAITAAAVAGQINGQPGITTRLVASAAGDLLILTSVEEGSGVEIIIYPRTSNTVTGFANDFSSRASGTTTIDRGDVFHLTATAYTTVGGDSGARVTLTDIRDDAADTDGIESQAVLYTQLESPLDDHSPLPADRVWAGIERLEVAGHPQSETWTSSKQLEQGFAPAFADQGQPGFAGELTESIEAVVTQQRSKIYLTRKSIWQVDGEGPALNGQGSFSRAARVFTDGGLVEDGWRSLLETAQGTWMQLGSDKLYLMPAGGAPTWAGFPIRELLRSFPVIVAATLTGNDQLAAFALQASNGASGRIALYDLRRGVWFIDDPGAVPAALADYGGRLCFADTSGTVFMQDASAGSGAFVPLTLATANANLFGAAGQGGVPRVYVVGQLLGECTLQLLVDYDDGAGFVTAGTFALTVANGYTVGQTIREEFELALEDCQQFALEVLVTGSSGSAGLALVAFEVHAERDAGPALLGDSFRR